MGDGDNPALRRILGDNEHADSLRSVATELSGADMTTLLMDVMRTRAAERSPADVLAQYDRDRFVAPAEADPLAMARLHARALEALAPQLTPVTLAPLAPLGTHSTVAGVSQNRVVTTTRMTEVAADPTNQLALEAAVRRRSLLRTTPKSTERVQLCAIDRVTRAQQFSGARSFAHFDLLGVVVAGRTTGSHRFETEVLGGLLSTLAHFVHEETGHPVRIALTDLDGGFADAVETIRAQVSAESTMCVIDPGRSVGTGYYENVCFKLSVDTGSEVVELGDGGTVDWTASLLQSRKERCVIAGIGLERLLSVSR